MATVVIENPTNLPEAADTGYMRQNTQAYAARTGFMVVGINNMDNAAAPSVQAGSVFEMNGALYKSAGDEGIGGNLGNGKCYVYAVPKAGGAVFQYSTAAPVWNTAKGGWYNGNNRALLRFEYAGGAYTDKVLMDSLYYDMDLKIIALLKLMKAEFEQALGVIRGDLSELGEEVGELGDDLKELGEGLSGLGEALQEALKKMAGFDIPPDSAVRTPVFSRTAQGEGCVTLTEGIYEVRMRGGKGGAGGNGNAQPGTDAGTLSGYFKVSGGSRTVFVDVGGAGGGDERYGGGGDGGSPGKPGSVGDSYYKYSGESPIFRPGGNGGSIMVGSTKYNVRTLAGSGGGGSSGISEQLTIGGGRAPSGTGAAVEIYRVAV
jgi:hypothetical protein